MSISQDTLIANAKDLAQEKSTVPYLVEPGDYAKAIDVALGIFDGDRPNRRTVHHTVASAGFRFVLLGAGSILTGADAWIDGSTTLDAVYHPFDTTVQGNAPFDKNVYRVMRDPAALVLELLDMTPSSGVLRIEFTKPHVLHLTDPAQSTILAGDTKALSTLAAAMLLQIWANRLVSNTGTTGIPSDVVDRRTQSDVARSRAKELMELYRGMIGLRTAGTLQPAGAIREVDMALHRGGLWKTRGSR